MAPQDAAQYGGGSSNILFPIALLIEVAFGALIALRLPRHPVGWLLLGSATVFLVDSGVITNFVIYAIDIRHRAIPGGDLVGTFEQELWILGIAPVAIFLPLVFPSGRLLSPRWRWVVWAAVASMVAGIVAGFGPSHRSDSMIRAVHPVSLPGPFAPIADVAGLGIILLPIWVLAGILSLVLRFRRGSGDERDQIKWLLLAISVYLVGFAASLIPSALGRPSETLQAIAIIGLALIPIAAAIAVLRYRLYDINVVISRTLVYGALAAFITVVYVGIVVGMGTLIGSGNRPNLVLSIVATAVVAVAFQPVREVLQRFANHLVYGKRSTPYEVLAEFSSRVAETYSGTDVIPRMARVLSEGTGAETATVWLRVGEQLVPTATHPLGSNGLTATAVTGQLLPQLPGSDRAVPVRHQGELLGALAVRKRPGESLTPIEEKLLDDLAHQAGLVLKNVGLTAELVARLEDLRASRQRLVAAQDEERRRLERNLHDGAQQHLVAIKVKLSLTEALMGKDIEKARSTLHQLKADADEALTTLRDLARGIYPPLLADQGLAAALEAQARRATLPVTVEAEGIRRHSQEVEAAVYFCCLEALQNVQKYARATRATVRLGETDDELTLTVEDDGEGFDPSTVRRGAGLTNMTDRLDALGGGLVVDSSPGRGTRLHGRVGIGGRSTLQAPA
jgi:signal transduction histidine kinase